MNALLQYSILAGLGFASTIWLLRVSPKQNSDFEGSIVKGDCIDDPDGERDFWLASETSHRLEIRELIRLKIASGGSGGGMSSLIPADPTGVRFELFFEELAAMGYSLEAMRLAGDIKFHSHREKAQTAVVRGWVRTDPSAALLALGDQNDTGLLVTALNYWVKIDPQSALEELKRSPSLSANIELQSAAIGGLVGTNPELALRWLRNSKNAGAISDRIFGRVRGLAAKHLHNTNANLQTWATPDLWRSELVSAAKGNRDISRWLVQFADTASATKLIHEKIREIGFPSTTEFLGADPEHSTLAGLERMAKGGMSSAPQETLDWVDQLSGLRKDQIQALKDRAAGSWVMDDQQGAITYLEESRLEDSLLSGQLIRSISGKLTSANRDSFLDLLDEIHLDSSVQAKDLRLAVSTLAYTSPAIDLLDRGFVSSLDDSTLDLVIRKVGEQEPGIVQTWLDSIAGESDPSAFEMAAPIVEGWARVDEQAASAYLAELRHGDFYDLGVVGLVKNLADSSPHAAVEWVTTIGDSDARRASIESLLSSQPDGGAGLIELISSTAPETDLDWINSLSK